jgi:hypothetical protein
MIDRERFGVQQPNAGVKAAFKNAPMPAVGLI